VAVLPWDYYFNFLRFMQRDRQVGPKVQATASCAQIRHRLFKTEVVDL